MKIIGLSGPAGAGKSTLASLLEERLGFTRTSLAGPLKEIALQLDPIIHIVPNPLTDDPVVVRLSEAVEKFGWDQAKIHFPEVRRTLQRLGTEAGREYYGESHWVDLHFRRNVEGSDTERRVVIEDVRFDNEASYVRDLLNGIVVRIVPESGVPHYAPLDDAENAAHASEHGVSDELVDVIVTNSFENERMYHELLVSIGDWLERP